MSPLDVVTPPVGLQANHTVALLYLLGTAVGLAAVLSYALGDARRTRSPLLGLLVLSGLTICPFAVEPAYDIVMATWYPSDLPVQLVHVAGRPMALMVVLMWGSSIPLTSYVAYRMVTAGASVRRIVTLLCGLSLVEGAGEMVASRFGVMSYYANHATVFGVPLPSLVQNAGMFAVIGVALAALLPHLRGWRWLLVLLVQPMLYLGYVMACTFPNVLAIHGLANRPLFWALAIVSTLLNGSVAVAALYTPTATHYREQRAQAGIATVPTQIPAGV